jgi:LCP family protein required for cell wall assembly
MRYVDIGTLSASQPTKGPAKQKHIEKKRGIPKIIKGMVWVVCLGLALFAIYSFLPPIKETLASFFNNSSSVFKYLVNGQQDLKQEAGKTNILLLGIDKRSVEKYTIQERNGTTEKGCFRTDSMTVVSYNYDSKKVTMVSIPRDLWVEIPAFGNLASQEGRINGAYCLGDLYNYPGGGMALSTKMISQVLGVPIQYTARIDFAGFQKAIDAIGGVDVDVKNAFVDYQYPIEGREDALPLSSRYKVVRFSAGLQHMDGETALEFARSRHASGVEGSDFSRSKRQEQVMVAFKDKVFAADTLQSPQELLSLYQSLGDSFATDIGPADLPTAYDLAKKIDSKTVTSYSIDDNADNPGGLLYNPPMSDYGGAWVLVPKDSTYAEIHQFVQQIFSDQGYPTPTPSVSPSDSITP